MKSRSFGNAAVASSAPHALHMPSHIYSMLGMWEESIKSNQIAVGAAKGYMPCSGPLPPFWQQRAILLPGRHSTQPAKTVFCRQ